MKIDHAFDSTVTTSQLNGSKPSCNESLQRGGKTNQGGNTGVKETKLQRADPLRVMT